MLAHSVQGNCPDCGSEDVHYSYRKDGSITKVYGSCNDCNTDFGRIGTITDNNNVGEKAQEKARNFFR